MKSQFEFNPDSWDGHIKFEFDNEVIIEQLDYLSFKKGGNEVGGLVK